MQYFFWFFWLLALLATLNLIRLQFILHSQKQIPAGRLLSIATLCALWVGAPCFLWTNGIWPAVALLLLGLPIGFYLLVQLGFILYRFWQHSDWEEHNIRGE